MLILSVVMLLVIYNFSVADVFNVYAENKRLESELKNIKTAPLQINQISSQLASLTFTTIDNISIENFHQSLLNEVTQYCQKENMVLKNFPEIHYYKKGNFDVFTAITSIQGSYFDLVKFLNHLETQFKFGKVISVSIRSKKDLKTKRTYLTGTFYVQTVKKSQL